MVSSQINTSVLFEKLEATLERLRARLPDLPTSNVLLSRLLLHLGRGMGALLEHQIRPFGLSEAEFRVLTTLFSQPDGVAHPTELCARTYQSPAHMSRISDALVERGLITRVPAVHDRRKMVLNITPQGEELVRQLLPTLYAPLREIFRDISDAEQLQLIGQLKRLTATMDQALSQHASEPERGE
jgi:MarR family transcriptional repressor of emrRAB